MNLKAMNFGLSSPIQALCRRKPPISETFTTRNAHSRGSSFMNGPAQSTVRRL